MTIEEKIYTILAKSMLPNFGFNYSVAKRGLLHLYFSLLTDLETQIEGLRPEVRRLRSFEELRFGWVEHQRMRVKTLKSDDIHQVRTLSYEDGVNATIDDVFQLIKESKQ